MWEIDKYDRLSWKARPDKTYLVTLPINVTKAIALGEATLTGLIEKTKARWTWFEEATKLNRQRRTCLGTLIYLPLEVRDMIYLILLDDYLESVIQNRNLPSSGFRKNMDEDLDMFKERHLTFRPCLLQVNRSHVQHYRTVAELLNLIHLYPFSPAPLGLQRASMTLQNEFRNVMRYESTFRFCCPDALRRFFGHLSTEQQSYLQRITIVIWDHCNPCTDYRVGEHGGYKSWMQINPDLPSSLDSLKSVKFDLGQIVHPTPRGGRAGYSTSTGQYEGGLPTEIAYIEEVKALLEIQTKQWRRRAPNAVVAMQDTTYFTEDDRLHLACVLDELD